MKTVPRVQCIARPWLSATTCGENMRQENGVGNGRQILRAGSRGRHDRAYSGDTVRCLGPPCVGSAHDWGRRTA